MKVLVCGKGGSGKSTITALLAKSMAKRSYNVLVVDSDESNFGLHRQLGVGMPEDFMNYLGGKKALVEKMMQAFQKGENVSVFENKWQIADIPEAYTVENGNIKMMVVGKIHDLGEGCACPMGALAKNLLKCMDTTSEDMILVDTEAGIEHFGRGVEEGCDLILMVLDPSYESIRLSEKIRGLAEKAGKSLYFILNRADEIGVQFMMETVNKTHVLASVPSDVEVFRAGFAGDELNVELPEIESIAEFLVSGAHH
ncbi:ATP-binding protein [Methanosarcina sp. 2.H.T.1A.6]|uniref:ATP-binding protein n=1 Tax=unclassified Methanosarcina TaxID=2644672 RepID=UPI000621E5C9|nr:MULTISPECIES: P-loop NTPase [unclassified Methanosarcina]KKG14689.1 ATP-binding protein [Methanosarcina sp. 2.H.T.1A.3]KKG20178.1 ATP-binding protein [Methanosarcina sp. 2.H.T.1A.6]KKG26901.1 ATP-binding protein [Methanosarcina sp. 2.H.T.1A.8]KKG27894.1 ATP-binding protein [Methanosarcina sp. 2.H.T.1A.15]